MHSILLMDVAITKLVVIIEIRISDDRCIDTTMIKIYQLWHAETPLAASL